MQFCLKEGVQMKQIVRKGRFLLFRATICYQMGPLFQTLRALLILPLNALRTLENRLVSCAFAPVQKQNQLAQNG